MRRGRLMSFWILTFKTLSIIIKLSHIEDILLNFLLNAWNYTCESTRKILKEKEKKHSIVSYNHHWIELTMNCCDFATDICNLLYHIQSSLAKMISVVPNFSTRLSNDLIKIGSIVMAVQTRTSRITNRETTFCSQST